MRTVLLHSLILLLFVNIGYGEILLQKCSYGERGSLTAICTGVTSTTFFKSTTYTFDYLDETLICKRCDLPTIKTETFDIAGNHLKKIILQNSSIELLQRRSFLGLIFVNSIDLSFNKISKIEAGTFEGIRKLKFINLNNNSLEMLEDERFKELLNLETLLLSRNKIKLLNENSFQGLYNLKTLDLSYNNILQIKNSFAELFNIEILDLSHNKLSYLSKNYFNGLNSLLELNLNYNDITLISFGIFNSLNNLRLLNFSNNNITKIQEKSFSNLGYLEVLDLSNNIISEVPQATFKDLFSLLYLNLTNNSLTEFNTKIYSGLPELMYINVSHNKINLIKPLGTFPLHNVHSLDLSYNTLEDVDLGRFLIRLPKISFLGLQGNKWFCKWKNFLRVNVLENLKFQITDAATVPKNCSKDDIFAFGKYFTSKRAQSVSELNFQRTYTADICIFVLIAIFFVVIVCLYLIEYRTYKLLK